MGFRKRYVWVMTSPKGGIKVFGQSAAMREAVPKGYRDYPKQESNSKWIFGKTKGKQFVAVRRPIEDSDSLPR